MTRRSFHRPSSIVNRQSMSVKGRIVSAGVRIGALAHAAGITPGGMTQYMTGVLRNRQTQRAIWIGFRGLTGQEITFQEFWGDLAAPAANKESAA